MAIEDNRKNATERLDRRIGEQDIRVGDTIAELKRQQTLN